MPATISSANLVNRGLKNSVRATIDALGKSLRGKHVSHTDMVKLVLSGRARVLSCDYGAVCKTAVITHSWHHRSHAREGRCCSYMQDIPLHLMLRSIKKVQGRYKLMYEIGSSGRSDIKRMA